MKKLELAYEIIKESKKSRALYLESGRDYHKVAAHMYSIFECYAHGLIKWNTARTYWHSSILEYLNLYKDNKKLYVMESNRMLAEYEDTLNRFKPALDEYKKVSEAKMVSNIVVKKQISESVAKDHSNIYFNKRSLSESAIKDIAHTTDWKKVVESYANLTSNDKDRLRMLTIFENDTFNVTGWSKLNEGPTLDTTQMITTVMSEAPTPTMNPADIKAAMSSSPSGMGNQRPSMVGSIAGGQIGRMAGRAIAGPIGGMVGKAIGSQIGSQVGTNIAMNRANAGKPSVAAPTLSTSGSTPSATAPTTSMRPKPRPMSRPMATEDAPKTSIRPVARPGRSLPGGGYEWPNGAVEPGAGAKFMTDMPRPMPRPAGLGANSSPRVNMADIYPPRGDMEMDTSNMAPPSKLAPTTSIRPQRRPASNVGRSEMSPTPGVWDGSTRGFESVQQEGYKTIKSIDKERYDEIPGLEGPFMTLSGKVVYYDPKEGSYYDRDTDMYLSYEEFKELDNDYSGMKNTREIKEAEEGTYMKQWYDYSEDFAMLELYVDGKLVDQWNDYFGANVTGNPLQQKFIDMAKKNGVDPIGLKVIDGEDGNEGVFTSRGLKWNSTEAKAKPGHNARAMARAQDIIRKSIEQSQKNADKKDDKKEIEESSGRSVGSRSDEMNKAAKKAHADAKEKSKKLGPVTSDTLKDINDKLGNNKKKVGEGELNENPFNQRLQKAPGSEMLPPPPRGSVPQHGLKFREGDIVVPHTGPHTGMPHRVITARSQTVSIDPLVSVKDHKYDNTTIRARHQDLSPYKPSVKEEADGEATHWEVSYDHGPHQSNTVSVKAKSKEEALDKAKQVAKDVHKHNRITSISISPKKNESLDEAESYVGRETKDGTWRVFKTGNAVAVAGPFKSAQEAQAWIKKQSVQEKIDEAVSFKLKVTNPATGNSETQEFNSVTAMKDYAARAKQRGLKVSRIKSTNEADSAKDLAIQAIQSKLKKAKVSYRDPNAKTAREEDRIAKMLAAKAKKKNESDELNEANTSYEKDMDENKPVVISGVKGVKSTPFRKKFKNMAAFERWSDTEEADNYEVHDIMNESVNEAVTLDYSRHVRSHGKKPRDPGYSALWMFTTREYDMPDDDEIFKFQGSFADAKKAAAKWAKTQGAYRVYVME